MSTQVILLRGINIGATNRLSMPDLRGAFFGIDIMNVQTYLQSGNVVVDSDLPPDELMAVTVDLLKTRFNVSVPVTVRGAQELRAVVDANPYPGPAAAYPKEFQVSFVSEPLSAHAVQLLADRRLNGDIVAPSACGREVYAWHPGGIHISKLAAVVTERKLGVNVATARNWNTVLALLEMVEGAHEASVRAR